MVRWSMKGMELELITVTLDVDYGNNLSRYMHLLHKQGDKA